MKDLPSHLYQFPVVRYFDVLCREFILMIITNLGMSLQYGSQYIYQTMPRMLTLWLDYGADLVDREKKTESSQLQGMRTMINTLNQVTVLAPQLPYIINMQGSQLSWTVGKTWRMGYHLCLKRENSVNFGQTQKSVERQVMNQKRNTFDLLFFIRHVRVLLVLHQDNVWLW